MERTGAYNQTIGLLSWIIRYFNQKAYHDTLVSEFNQSTLYILVIHLPYLLWVERKRIGCRLKTIPVVRAIEVFYVPNRVHFFIMNEI